MAAASQIAATGNASRSTVTGARGEVVRMRAPECSTASAAPGTGPLTGPGAQEARTTSQTAATGRPARIAAGPRPRSSRYAADVTATARAAVTASTVNA